MPAIGDPWVPFWVARFVFFCPYLVHVMSSASRRLRTSVAPYLGQSPRWEYWIFVLIGAACAPPVRNDPSTALLAAAQVRVGAYTEGTHSHNDYERRRPLFDALERGFASIEADVVLKDGELYVIHEEAEARPSLTLIGAYLDPLRVIARSNGGWVYGPEHPSLQLLLDVKTDAVETHRVLNSILKSYDDILTSWHDGVERRGPVMVVLSGNRAFETVLSAETRYMSLDGRIYDDRIGISAAVMPLVSINWDDTETRGIDRIDQARSFIDAVHAEGRKVRFWGTSDRVESWAWLKALGVDYVGADRIEELHEFFRR